MGGERRGWRGGGCLELGSVPRSQGASRLRCLPWCVELTCASSWPLSQALAMLLAELTEEDLTKVRPDRLYVAHSPIPSSMLLFQS